MTAIPAHELKRRGPSVLVEYNWFASYWVSIREVANPRYLVSIYIFENDRRTSRFYVPHVVVAASTIIEHNNHREAAPMFLQVVGISATMAMAGTMTRSTPLAMVGIIIPMVPMIVAVSPIVPVRPVSIRPITPIRTAVVTVGSPVITIGSTLVVSAAGVVAAVIGWVSGLVSVV